MKNHYPLKHVTLVIVSLLLISFSIEAQIIVENEINGENLNNYNPFFEGQYVSQYVSSPGIARGAGIEGNDAINRYNARDWNVEDLNEDKYFSFEITPDEGFFIDFFSFEFTTQVSSTGPVFYALRSNLDNFQEDIGSLVAGENIIFLNSQIYREINQTIEFRLFAWGATQDVGTFSVNDFILRGYVYSNECPHPSFSGEISGPAEVIPFSNGNIYRVNEIPRANSYVWSVPQGASIINGQGSNEISVAFDKFSGEISVYGVNLCGNGVSLGGLYVTCEYPVIYHHDFGTNTIDEHPYTDEPVVLFSGLDTSLWANSNNEWKSYAGVGGLPGQALAARNLENDPVLTLSLCVKPGYEMRITAFDFWKKSSPKGPSGWQLFVDNVLLGEGSSTTSGLYVGKTELETHLVHLTDSVLVTIELIGASNVLGTFRFDDFQLFGEVSCIPMPIESPDDVHACEFYTLPATNYGIYNTEPLAEGDTLEAGDVINFSQIIYIFNQHEYSTECYSQSSFNVGVHPNITTNAIQRR
ncbi:MAG: hypothetical protein PF436_04860 [Prolixibacteraceae bacterium]|jgi:hypothetical protein|nr:hypothetical protein [Prolixibacteraceae bacterium]